jgi:signal transduction histidine kinase
MGVGLSVAAAVFVQRWELASNQTRFQRQIENLTTLLQRSLNRYTDVLVSISDYYAANELQVGRQEFGRFVQRSLRTYPGIRALEWAPLVQRSARSAYESEMRSAGYPNFRIQQLTSENQLVTADDRPFYVPVTYIEPFISNEKALGYDLNSNPTRSSAIQIAQETGESTATGRIRLVQENQDQFGFLVFLPVYQPKPTSSPSLTSQSMAGFLLGVFRVADVVEESLQSLSNEINFVLYDQNAEPEKQFLGFYDATRKRVLVKGEQVNSVEQGLVKCAPSDDCTRRLEVGQRQWRIVFFAAPTSASRVSYGAIATLLIGLLLTGSLVLFLHTLNQELARTKGLSELKLRLFSMASHELRTPLSTILLSSESMQVNRDYLTEDQKQKNIQRIYLTAKRMSQQITDILTLTRAEVGKLEFSPELFELEAFCEQLVEEMQSTSRRTLIFDHNGQPHQVFMDKKLLRSLLTNLLSNSIKYSLDDTPIHFQLSCDDNAVIFQISDQGIGIPLEDQSRIYETFYRAQNVGDITGTGLGLAVVKTCVDLHQGDIMIDSEPGKGAIVTVKIPRRINGIE